VRNLYLYSYKEQKGGGPFQIKRRFFSDKTYGRGERKGRERKTDATAIHTKRQ
jgi:hypothetical protein